MAVEVEDSETRALENDANGNNAELRRGEEDSLGKPWHLPPIHVVPASTLLCLIYAHQSMDVPDIRKPSSMYFCTVAYRHSPSKMHGPLGVLISLTVTIVQPSKCCTGPNIVENGVYTVIITEINYAINIQIY